MKVVIITTICWNIITKSCNILKAATISPTIPPTIAIAVFRPSSVIQTKTHSLITNCLKCGKNVLTSKSNLDKSIIIIIVSLTIVLIIISI